MTIKQQEINSWLTSLFPDINLTSLQYIQSDASQRKYLRLQTNDNFFYNYGHNPRPRLKNFVTTAKIFMQHNITVPEIIHSLLRYRNETYARYS